MAPGALALPLCATVVGLKIGDFKKWEQDGQAEYLTHKKKTSSTLV